jgi:tetratricopeptide (TPR) repeat protein
MPFRVLNSIRQQYRRGELEEVERRCRLLLPHSGPNKSAVQALLAIVLLQRRKINEGCSLLNLVNSDVDNLDPLALADLGGGYIVLNESEKALPLLEKAIFQQPNLAIAHGRAGMALMKLGRLSDAKKMLQKAQKLEPGESAYSVNLSRIHLMQARPDQALAELNRTSLFPPPQLFPKKAELRLCWLWEG